MSSLLALAGDILHLFHVIPVPMPQVVGAGLAGEVTFVMQDPREDVSHVRFRSQDVKEELCTNRQESSLAYVEVCVSACKGLGRHGMDIDSVVGR